MGTTIPYNTMSSRRSVLLTDCCCCFPLRLGCLVLAYLNSAFNILNTLGLILLTTYLGATTHGFDHFDLEKDNDLWMTGTTEGTLDVEAIERPMLTQLGTLLILIILSNVAWLIVNIACIVGLHNKRPGPIRVYVAFASVRLLLSLAGFIYIMTTSVPELKSVIGHIVDLILVAYFIMVYYSYAVQLEMEIEQTDVAPAMEKQDIAYVYPTKNDKHILV